MSEHHLLDTEPKPLDKVLYINEPWLVDLSLPERVERAEPEKCDDNVRVYVPLDLNREAILRRLECIIQKFGEANEKNELDFEMEVSRLIGQIEIYDQIWHVRHWNDARHSDEAKLLVKKFVVRLGTIPDGCAERFPFELIKELQEEYGGEVSLLF